MQCIICHNLENKCRCNFLLSEYNKLDKTNNTIIIDNDTLKDSSDSNNSNDLCDSDILEKNSNKIPLSIKKYIGPDVSDNLDQDLIKSITMLKFKDNGLMIIDSSNNITFVLDENTANIFNKPIGYKIKYDDFSDFIKDLY